ncbi:uncharacterized protein [Misgurnus anguillicaudatus]|uniref:uncharacterized protein n=1 Tax=Misgurnus anguillicaudatus TaxID=75329 RepID=UPI003CCF51E0
MERNIIITLVCVWFCVHQRIFGTEMKMKVKPGDNVTLFCDCVIPLSYFIVWFRNCTHEHQPSLLINAEHFFKGTFPRFNFVHNSSSNTFDLHIKNISVYDEGIYYCAKAEKKISGTLSSRLEYQYGNRSTHLAVLVSGCREMSSSTVSPPPPVSDCFLYLGLLVSVCVVCFLLCFICVYCLCQRKTTGFESAKMLTVNVMKMDPTEKHQCQMSKTGKFCHHTEVTYRLLPSVHRYEKM